MKLYFVVPYLFLFSLTNFWAPIALGQGSDPTLSSKVPDFLHQSSTECKQCLDCDIKNDRSRPLRMVEATAVMVEKLRRGFMLKVARSFEIQAAKGKAAGVQMPALNKYADTINNKCRGYGSNTGNLNSLFAKAKANGEKIGSRISPAASALYKRQIAVALAEASIIKSRYGLTTPTLPGKYNDRLKHLRINYPEVESDKIFSDGAFEYGQQILIEASPTDKSGNKSLKGNWMNKNSGGADSAAMRGLAFDDLDDIVDSADRFLFPGENKKNIPAEPSFKADTYGKRIFKDLMTKPLTPKMEAIVEKSLAENMDRAMDAAGDICGMSLCELSQLNGNDTRWRFWPNPMLN